MSRAPGNNQVHPSPSYMQFRQVIFCLTNKRQCTNEDETPPGGPGHPRADILSDKLIFWKREGWSGGTAHDVEANRRATQQRIRRGLSWISLPRLNAIRLRLTALLRQQHAKPREPLSRRTAYRSAEEIPERERSGRTGWEPGRAPPSRGVSHGPRDDDLPGSSGRSRMVRPAEASAPRPVNCFAVTRGIQLPRNLHFHSSPKASAIAERVRSSSLSVCTALTYQRPSGSVWIPASSKANRKRW